MTALLKPFGVLADGRPVRAATLAWEGGLAVEILEYGAAVRRLCVPLAGGGAVEAVLGFADPVGYERDAGYQGVVVGRCANRIADAAFVIDGRRHTVSANEGPNCLHGGASGFSKRLWRFEEVGEDGRSAVLIHASPDGEEGFPGAVAAKVRFTLTAPNVFEVVWEAVTDRPTPINLTQHLYFNLSGDPCGDILDHTLQIRADAVTPVRPDLIPTGELLPVAGTPFDLRRPRRLRDILAQAHPQLAIPGGYDHNWVLSAGAGPALALHSPETDLSLFVDTDQPGVQVYSGQGLKPPFAAFGGLALEPQNFPDAVNQPGFPEAVLRPGRLYRRWAAYRFESGGGRLA